ncbi:MAG: hypothetical protein OEY11_08225 [Gammaproteobacteria bacterium]|nr:hypothetical protein [Gammaproteobacteria bacterium]
MKHAARNLLSTFLLSVLQLACTEGPEPPDSVEVVPSDITATDDSSAEPVLNIIATANLHLNGEVLLTSSSLSVKVAISHSGTDIELTAGDELVVNTGGEDTVLVKHVSHSTAFSAISWSFVTTTNVNYSTLIPLDKVYSDIVQIKFLRPNAQDAINTTVTIPAAIEIQSPQAGQIYSRSMDDIVIEWSHPQTMHYVDIEAYKLVGLDDWTLLFFEFNADGVDDNGLYSIAASSIEASTIDLSNQTVMLDISLTRGAAGSIDENLNQASGLFRAYNKTTVSISSIP